MARAMTEEEKREVTFLIVTDRERGSVLDLEMVRACDYSRKDSYYRGVRRAHKRLLEQYPKVRATIQMCLALSMHPIAHWAS